MDDQEPTSSQWRRYARLKAPSRKAIRQRARKIESSATKHAHRFILSRLSNLRDVRRHVVGWLLLAVLLSAVTLAQMMWVRSAYVSSQPSEGGVYAEGVIGRIDTLNPLYTGTQSERSVTALIFSSLLKYDYRNNLEGDLAEGYSRSEDGKTYTVTLRKGVQWHDNRPVTADDIEFTVKLMKNPQAKSYLYRSWQDIKVKKVDRYNISFELPSPYAPFPHLLTFGVLPKHILNTTPPSQLRAHSFSRNPVGSGPFVFRSIQTINPALDRSVVQVAKNPEYHFGAVKLDRFQFHTYKNHDELRKGFLSREINSANELTTSDIETIKKSSTLDTVVADASLNNGVYGFMRTDSPLLSDPALRHALVKAVDQRAILKKLNNYASPLGGPILDTQLGYSSGLKQTIQDDKTAVVELENAGWKLNGQYRVKDGQRLTITVTAPKKDDFPAIANEIKRQWSRIGVEVNTQLVDTDVFEQNVLKARAYDVLIYEIALGADSDMFAYWHSSQARATGMNYSNYKSPVADSALVSARARIETDLRSSKYNSFIQQWIDDAPAVALYQTHMHYVTTADVSSVKSGESLIDSLGRYHTISDWTARKSELFKTP